MIYFTLPSLETFLSLCFGNKKILCSKNCWETFYQVIIGFLPVKWILSLYFCGTESKMKLKGIQDTHLLAGQKYKLWCCFIDGEIDCCKVCLKKNIIRFYLQRKKGKKALKASKLAWDTLQYEHLVPSRGQVPKTLDPTLPIMHFSCVFC